MNIKAQDLAEILKKGKHAFLVVAFFSFLVNILMLTIPVFMLQVFDRVLASQSYDTLIYLTIVALVALLTMTLLDIVRGRVLVRVSRWLDKKLSPLALLRSADNLLGGDTYGSQCLKDITNVRQFISGTGIFALFDAPWVPVYLFVVFLLYPALGFIATAGSVILFGFAILNEMTSRGPLGKANSEHTKNQEYMDSALNNAETIQAMGMLNNVVHKWYTHNEEVLKLQGKASDVSGIVLASSKFLRLVLQVAIMGTGAALVIKGHLTGGAMIAGSIITARALAPIEQSIGTWKMFVSARGAYNRLKKFLNMPSTRHSTIELPKAKGIVQFDNVVYVPPGSRKPILQGVTFSANPGDLVAVIGPSGSGKSTLGRLMLGIWPPSSGSVRLDGATVFNWDRANFGKQVGYTPQRAQLFVGTVKDNIARMGKADDEAVIKAAKMADAHEMILHLTHGYETPAHGFGLSGGQTQRVALARAFYGDPCLMVLDEPETNLDKEGEEALMRALRTAKEAGKTVLLISQRPSVVEASDKVLVLNQGRVQAYGPTKEVLSEMRHAVEDPRSKIGISKQAENPEGPTDQGEQR